MFWVGVWRSWVCACGFKCWWVGLAFGFEGCCRVDIIYVFAGSGCWDIGLLDVGLWFGLTPGFWLELRGCLGFVVFGFGLGV